MNYNSLLILVVFFTGIISCNEAKGSSKQEQETVKKTEIIRLPYFNTALFTPEWTKGTHKIPEFSFTNQRGDEVTHTTFRGKIYIANFFFTICPGICSKLTKNMGVLQEAYREDKNIMLLSHTVMPWKDTVEELSVYAQKNAVKLPQWHLVTGATDAIYMLARKGYFADEDFVKTQDESAFIHTENFVLVDKEGYIRGVYNGTLPLEIKRLMRHIEILKKE